jgi:CheY-like chemotaxis protein
MTRVLVVDDDAGIRSIVAELLEDEGCTVDTAGDGAQALQRAREAPPAAILLDLIMPVLDRWEFVEACRQQAICLGVPVVVMSAAHGLHALTERLIQRGVRAVVTKPFDATALIALVG